MMPEWDAERLKALDLNRDVIVEASAGTGKTTLLVERVLRTLRGDSEHAPVPPEQVLIVTFTREAARSLRDKLAMELSGDPNLRDRLGLLEASTIDAWSSNLLRRYGLAIGLDPTFEVIDQDEEILEFDRLLADEVASLTLDERNRDMVARLGLSGIRQRTRLLRDHRDIVAPFLARIRRGGAKVILESWGASGVTAVTAAEWMVEITGIHDRVTERIEAGTVNRLAFGDVLDRVARLLYAPTEDQDLLDLRLRLRTRYRAVFVDEAQDTNPRQWDILFSLLGPAESGQRLFVVGDPKQSIYRFRGADVRQFQRVRKEIRKRNLSSGAAKRPGPPGITLSADEAVGDCRLERNFRTPTSVTTVVNHVFSRMMVVGGDSKLNAQGAVDYSPILPGKRADGTEPPVGSVRFIIATNEMATLAQEVDELRTRLPDMDLGEVAILLRSTKTFPDLARELRRRGIGVRFEGSKGLGESPEFRDLLAFLSVMAEERESGPLLSLLRSPLLALTDELIWQVGEPGTGSRNLPAQEIISRLAIDAAGIAASTSIAAWRQAAPYGLSRAYRQALRDSGAYAGYRATLRGLASTANLPLVIALLEEVELKEGPRTAQVLAALRLWQRTEGADRAVGIPVVLDRSAVRVLTIHKAKGLEFDHVFIPQLARKRSYDSGWFIGPEDLVYESRAVRHRNTAGDGKHPRERDIDLQQRVDWSKEAQDHELQRLLYVAMTRTRQTLVMIGQPRLTVKGAFFKEGWIKYLIEAGFPTSPSSDWEVGTELTIPLEDSGAAPMPATGDLEEVRLPEGEPEPAQAILHPGTILSATSLADHARCPYRYKLRHIDRIPHMRILTPSGELTDAEKGTLIHARLQYPDAPAMTLVARVLPDRLGQLQGADLAFLAKVPKEKDLLTGGEQGGQYEVPFQLRVGEAVFRGRIDYLKMGSGRTLVVDWKSGRGDPDRIRQQLEIYALACEGSNPQVEAKALRTKIGERPIFAEVYEVFELRAIRTRLERVVHGIREQTRVNTFPKVKSAEDPKPVACIGDQEAGIDPCLFHDIYCFPDP